MSTSKKKLIILSANTSWYLYNFRASTIRAFVEQGHRVMCLSPKDDYSKRLQALGCEWMELKVDNKGKNPFKDLSLFVRYLLIYGKVKPFIAFHFTVKNNIYGTLAAFLFNIPVINNITGLGTAFINSNFTSRVVQFLYKLSQPLAQKIFCQNQEDFDLLVRHNLAPESRLGLLPGSGVDLERFHPRLRDSFKDENRLFRFLFAGRMLSDKGLYELIDAMREINKQDFKCDLWLCGFVDSENSSVIPDKILESWKINKWIKWIGPSDRVEEVMAQVDCLVLPSYREGMPKCILEANAMSLPVVTTDVPGCRNIVKNGLNGLICSPRDSSALAAVMTKMINMPSADRNLMGQAGREIVTNSYDERLVIQSAVDVVNNNILDLAV